MTDKQALERLMALADEAELLLAWLANPECKIQGRFDLCNLLTNFLKFYDIQAGKVIGKINDN